MKATTPQRSYLDRAEQVEAILAAAGELDANARSDYRGLGRRALLATLVFAGLRIGEALALRWRDVDLAGGRLRVGEAKTNAGVREVELLPALRDELTEHKVNAARSGPADLVFRDHEGASADRHERAEARAREGGRARRRAPGRGGEGTTARAADAPLSAPYLRLGPVRAGAHGARGHGAARARGPEADTADICPRDEASNGRERTS